MDTFQKLNQPTLENDRLALASFLLGLATVIFAVISIVYALTKKGGPGYVQGLFCGVPVALASIITGMVDLLQRKLKKQNTAWTAVLGIGLGILFFVVSFILVFILLEPFLFEGTG